MFQDSHYWRFAMLCNPLTWELHWTAVVGGGSVVIAIKYKYSVYPVITDELLVLNVSSVYWMLRNCSVWYYDVVGIL